MLKPENSALLLLAAGRSRRFGNADKLAVPYLGRPIGMHAVVALEAIPFARRIAVIDGTSLPLAEAGYEVVVNDDPAAGLGRSLCLGAERVIDSGVDAVVIALADMPLVTAAQVLRLFDAADGVDSVVASSDGRIPRPPALFGSAHFGALLGARGDQGMRPLIAAGRHVVTMPRELIDIDTPDDLAALERGLPTGRGGDAPNHP